jgi:hypothetical protein
MKTRKSRYLQSNSPDRTKTRSLKSQIKPMPCLSPKVSTAGILNFLTCLKCVQIILYFTWNCEVNGDEEGQRNCSVAQARGSVRARWTPGRTSKLDLRLAHVRNLSIIADVSRQNVMQRFLTQLKMHLLPQLLAAGPQNRLFQGPLGIHNP